MLFEKIKVGTLYRTGRSSLDPIVMVAKIGKYRMVYYYYLDKLDEEKCWCHHEFTTNWSKVENGYYA
jgi:hypothetical protein